MQQSLIINQMARKMFISDYSQLKLDEGFKERLQQRINNQMEKS